ncbi:hypothetical protein [Janibacter anophelis]|uniref:hypothetical protein n=1 Tax=Janibacter anophelis TaxID=319054 RepID=UPI0008304DB7|nr:hypothetical protein [Janibacter anophelis]
METGGSTISDDVPTSDGSVALAVTQYAAACRDALDQAETSVVSHAGLWLLLAHAAEHVTGPERADLENLLGMPSERASEVAREFFVEPHPTLAAAVGAWAAPDAHTPLDVDRPIPDQSTLDAWASERTRGLIESFPADVDPMTRILLATALVLEPRWIEPLHEEESGDLVLDGGLQAIVRTEAAGDVVVAKPHTADGVDVLSVAAAPEVPPSRVWQAVDEVVALLDDGVLRHASRPDALPDTGHSWRSWTEQTEMLAHEVADLPVGPDGRRSQWRSRLRPWTASATLDLTTAPGVAEVAHAILPDEPAADTECVQAVRAEYDKDGFRAAAVTAMMRAGSAPLFETVEVEHVELDLTGTHAVVAIARGGAWEGVPLVSAWVTPDQPRPERTRDGLV